MNKKCVKISSIVLLFLLIIIFASKNIERINIFNNSNDKLIVSKQIKKDNAQFVDKTWIMKTDADETVDEPLLCSFYITDMDEDRIEGKFARGQIVQRDYYLYGEENEPVGQAYQGSFSGYIDGEMAQCTFDDGRGFAGQLNMDFQDNLIQVEIIVDEEMSRPDWFDGADYSGDYSFVPWNLVQETSFLADEDNELEGVSDYWGAIRLITGEMTALGKKYPCVFITDQDKNILYQFDLGYDEKMQIRSCSLEDLNQDGLTDIEVTTSHDIWHFYQQRNGCFVEKRQGEEKKVCNEDYLYKRWICREDGDEKADAIQLSFYFTQISEECVRGRFCIGGLAENECFSMLSKAETRMNLGTGYFEGKLINESARCKFQNEDGKTGWITISFENENALTAMIEWGEKEYNSDLKAGSYVLEAYNIYERMISDKVLANTKISEELSCDINFKKWGEVKLLICESTNPKTEVRTPLFYITDKDGYLLYEFDVSSPNNCIITNLQAEDIDGDKDEDIVVTISLVGEKKTGEELQYMPIEKRYFYQQSNGTFLYRKFNAMTKSDMSYVNENVFEDIGAIFAKVEWYTDFDKEIWKNMICTYQNMQS